MKTQEALKCPSCGHDGDFVVECLEYVQYEYSNGELVGPADDYENQRVPDTPFGVTCPACGHAWNEDAWE